MHMKHVHTHIYIYIYNLDGEDGRLVDLVQVLLDPLSSQATDLSMRFGVVNGRDMRNFLRQKETYKNKED